MARKQFALRLESGLFDRTQALAERLGMPMNTVVAVGVAHEVDRLTRLVETLDLVPEEPQP